MTLYLISVSLTERPEWVSCIWGVSVTLQKHVNCTYFSQVEPDFYTVLKATVELSNMACLNYYLIRFPSCVAGISSWHCFSQMQTSRVSDRVCGQIYALSGNSGMEEWRYTGRNVLRAHVSAYSAEVKWEKGMNASVRPWTVAPDSQCLSAIACTKNLCINELETGWVG